jgi:hypothetical protein
VVPRSSRVAGSGVAAKDSAKPDALTENCNECDPGDSPKKRVCEPEPKELQLTANPQALKPDASVMMLSRDT